MKVLNSYIVLNIANRIQKTGIRSCFEKKAGYFLILRHNLKLFRCLFFLPEKLRKWMLWKATATAEKEMQNMKHVWKRYLIVTAMTVVLGLSAGCGSAVEDTNNNQNNTQDENTPDGNENKNNNGTSPDTNTDMNNDGTNGTNNNMNGATSGEGTVDENGNRLDENGNIIEDLGEDVGEGIKDVGDGIGEGVEDLTGGGSRDANQQNAR